MTARVNVGGIVLAYSCEGEGPPVLLISGVGYGGWFWHRLAPRLTQAHRVLSFDNRGVGGSDQPPGPYSTRAMAEDTAGLIAALRLGPCHVVGHSLGGFIAQELALAFPDCVRSLALLSTSHGGPHALPVTPEALEVMTDRSGTPEELVRRGLAVATAPGLIERDPALVAALLEYRLGGPVTPECYRAQVLAGAAHDSEARIGELRLPTLVVTGAEDRVVPPANSTLLQSKILGARLVSIPEAGHLLPLERPAPLGEALRSFWSEVETH